MKNAVQFTLIDTAIYREATAIVVHIWLVALMKKPLLEDMHDLYNYYTIHAEYDIGYDEND